MEGYINITQEEYKVLIRAKWKLTCLENAGVDNWEGYDYAMELMEETD